MRWLQWRYWQWVLMALMLFFIFLALFDPLFYYVIVGYVIGLGLMFALVEVVSPRSFLRWRAEQISGASRFRRDLANALDQGFGVPSHEPWKDPRAIRTTRIIGGVLFLIGVILGYVLLFLVMPPYR